MSALAAILAIHRIAADPAQMRHDLGHDAAVSVEDVLRIAKRIADVRAKAIKASVETLSKQPLPALAVANDGSWFVIGRVADGRALIQHVGEPPTQIDLDELAGVWSGDLVLITTRESVGGALAKFDVRWFIPQIVKYRRLIGEVLLVTFAMNLLGLAAPLFFQNVIDKVLVHNTLATLNVLVLPLRRVP
jgi:ATP-binding cassette, subfamily B, bacterial HlyB/CyaB